MWSHSIFAFSFPIGLNSFLKLYFLQALDYTFPFSSVIFFYFLSGFQQAHSLPINSPNYTQSKCPGKQVGSYLFFVWNPLIVLIFRKKFKLFFQDIQGFFIIWALFTLTISFSANPSNFWNSNHTNFLYEHTRST
jgi:hypothetical protein